MSKEKTPFDRLSNALTKIQKLLDAETRRTYKRMKQSQDNKRVGEYNIGLDVGSYEQASAMQFSINNIIAKL